MGALLAAAPVLAEDAPEPVDPGAADAAKEAEGAKARKQRPRNQQGAKSAEARVKALEKRLLADIELTDAQQQSLDELEQGFLADVEEHQAKVQSLRDQMKEARDLGETEKIKEFGTELRNSRKNTPRQITWIDELRDILTPDQQKQYDANREKIQRESKGRSGRQRPQ
jgi:hypothetical protein